jgi:hypothetical protein
MTGVSIYESVAGQAIVEWTGITVESREEWSGSWEAVDYLEALRANEVAAPNLSSAVFRYRYAGELKREDSTSFGTVDPIELAGHFVRIRGIPQATGQNSEAKTIWVGVVTGEAFDILGTESGGDPMGDQIVYAVGLDHLLDRRYIDKAWAASDDGSEDIEIGWAPVFNARYRRGTYELGNKGTASGDGAVFGGDDVWTFKEIADYVLDRFGPSDLELELSGQTADLGDVIDIVPQEGRTPRQILNHVISRVRGHGWTIRYDDKTDKAKVHVYTLVGETVSFGSYSLSANGEKASMAFDDARDIGRAIVMVDESALYDEVLVLDARVRSCFSLRVSDGSLDQAWTGGEQDSYVGKDLEDPQKNDLARGEDRYWRVFQAFGPPADWDWKVGKNEDGGGGKHVVPKIDDDGTVMGGENSEGPAIRAHKGFLRKLPFEKSSQIDHAEPEFLDPFAIVQIPEDASEKSSGGSFAKKELYGHVESLWAFGFSSGMVRMMDRELGVHISTSPRHALALNHFQQSNGGAWGSGGTYETGDRVTVGDQVYVATQDSDSGDPQKPGEGSRHWAKSDPGATEWPPQVDWSTLVVTVNLETDERLKVRCPIGEKDNDDEPARVLVVNVPDAEYWHVVDNTVTYLLDGKPRTGSGNERDDSDRLRAIAAWCKAWYGKPRSRVDLLLQKTFFGLRVGTYVTDASSSWHSKRVGTVVTERSWTFGDRPGAQPSTRIRTDYLEPVPELMG